MLRFSVERHPDGDIIVRLPLRVGVSFWSPWWSLMFGVTRTSMGIQWHLGPFGGEAWIDDDTAYLDGKGGDGA